MSKKKASSKRWLQRQHRDIAVKTANKKGFRSRAAIKLLEINKKHNILTSGIRVLDLGCVPGSWSQVAIKIIGDGYLLAVDLQTLSPIPKVNFLQGDILLSETWDKIEQIALDKFDGVLSDCGPASCGLANIDHIRSVTLNEEILVNLDLVLKKGGWFLGKILAGGESSEFENQLKHSFTSFSRIKPPSSRSQSREYYFLAKGKK